MYKNKKIVALIPARGGSKGILHKNIVCVNGRPLIEYSIEAALNSKYIDDCYVSTEDSMIKNVALNCKAKIIERPIQLADDSSKTIDVVLHAIKYIERKYDYIILLQPTQPLRKTWQIDEAIERIIDCEYPSLVSVSPVKKHPVLIRKMNDDNRLTKMLSQTSTVRRQDFEKYYAVNGAIYINRIIDLNENTSFNDNEYGYIMDEIYDVDIDEPFDLIVCEAMMKYEN